MFLIFSTKFRLLFAVVLSQIIVSSGHDADIVKRRLRWNLNRDIVSDVNTAQNIRVDYLVPHANSVKVLKNRNYIAFTTYQKYSNQGIFHFIDSEKADVERLKCTRETMHEGAYYYFYGKCPEDEHNLVASGYCYQGSNGRGLVYNSYTFNSKFTGMTYLDGQYYLDDDRVMHETEQLLVRSCFNLWESADFPLHSWSCPLANIPLASGLSAKSQGSEVSSGQCDDCECSGSHSMLKSVQGSFIMIFATMACFLNG